VFVLLMSWRARRKSLTVAGIALPIVVVVIVVTSAATASLRSSGNRPHLSERRILRIAEAAAARAGDRRPTLIQHSEGGRHEANLVDSGEWVPGGAWSYLIAEQGHFVLKDVSLPLGARPPTGSVLTLIIDARTGEITDLGLTNRYPHLARLGLVHTDLRRATAAPWRSTKAALSPAAPSPPQRLSATHMPPRRSPFAVIRPGTIVPAREVNSQAFADPQHGFGLANVPDGQIYPAATVDGGRTWRINGPVFHVPAADGAEGVGYTGVASARSYFAYGSSVVDVTTDGGKSWWETYLGELVLAVVAQPHHLIAVVQQQATTNSQSLKSVNWIYVSRDGGRHWRYDDLLGATDK
jgi:hypothetical protein